MASAVVVREPPKLLYKPVVTCAPVVIVAEAFLPALSTHKSPGVVVRLAWIVATLVALWVAVQM